MRHLMIAAFCLFTSAAYSQKADSTKKQWLGMLTLTEKYQDEKNWTKEDQGIVGQHFQRLLDQKKAGVVILAGRTQYETNNPDMLGLVIFYAADEKAALQFMMEDPAVKNKIMLTRVHPYGVAIKCD